MHGQKLYLNMTFTLAQALSNIVFMGKAQYSPLPLLQMWWGYLAVNVMVYGHPRMSCNELTIFACNVEFLSA